MQYIRVIVVVGGTPVIASLVFGAHAGAQTEAQVSVRAIGWFTAAWLLGLSVARILRTPAAALLAPMIIAAAIAVSGRDLTGAPAVLQNTAFLLIGLQVGLAFTPTLIRHAAQLAPVALGFTIGVLVVCGLLGLLLVPLVHATPLEGYLATTPGGLSAVLAIALAQKSNITFVMAAQVIRTFLMLLAAPVLSSWLRSSDPGKEAVVPDRV